MGLQVPIRLECVHTHKYKPTEIQCMKYLEISLFQEFSISDYAWLSDHKGFPS